MLIYVFLKVNLFIYTCPKVKKLWLQGEENICLWTPAITICLFFK